MENSFRISGLVSESPLLENNIFLVLMNVIKVPPHLALSVNGKHFSLSTKGPVIEGNMGALISLIKQKNIPSLFIQLKFPLIFSYSDLQREIISHFTLHPSVNENITCLTPIRSFCSSVYETEMKNVSLVFDLLQTLSSKQLTGSVFHYNLNQHVKNGEFYMPLYSFGDVHLSIRNNLSYA